MAIEMARATAGMRGLVARAFAGVALLAVALLFAGMPAPVAHAAGPYTINPDCPDRLLQRYNSANYSDRCMGGLYAMAQVGAGNYNDYNRCATAKYNANGSGGDAFQSICGTGTITLTPCYNTSTKYPGVINHGPNAHHLYWGWLVTSANDC